MAHRYCAVLILVAGCAQAPTAPVVQVPVPVSCPTITKPDRPHLPTEDLTAGSAPDVVAKAYASSLAACVGYSKALEELLK